MPIYNIKYRKGKTESAKQHEVQISVNKMSDNTPIIYAFKVLKAIRIDEIQNVKTKEIIDLEYPHFEPEPVE